MRQRSFESLVVVSSGVLQGEAPQLDIVAVPGLSRFLPAGKGKDHEQWLRDVIGKIFVTARIMAFHFEYSDERDGFSWEHLLNQGSRLLYALSHIRERVEKTRPIIFICHTFGGLVVKQMLLNASLSAEYANIYLGARSILFLGTIHDHTHSEFENKICKCAAVELGAKWKKDPILDYLTPSQKLRPIKELSQSFHDLQNMIDPVSVCESRKTLYATSAGGLRQKYDILCPQHMAMLKKPGEQVISANVDHLQIAEYPDQRNPFLEILIRELRPLVAKCEASQGSEANSSLDTERDPRSSGELRATIHSQAQALHVELDMHPGTETIRSILFDHLNLDHTILERLPVHSSLPLVHNEDFVGREDVLMEIEGTLLSEPRQQTHSNRPRIFTLHAAGGMGKTETALAFLSRNKTKYRTTLWTTATDRANLSQQFASHTMALGLVSEASADQTAACTKLLQWFSTTLEPWLLILDNADDMGEDNFIADFQPTGSSGSILITTRNRWLVNSTRGTAKELEKLGREPSIQLLLKLTKKEISEVNKELAGQIVDRFDRLPLGISTAANIICNEFSSLEDFLSEHDNRDLILSSTSNQSGQFDLEAVTRYGRSLSTIWNWSLHIIKPKALQLAIALAFFNTSSVQEGLFYEGALRSKSVALQHIDNRKKFIIVRAQLVGSGLVSYMETQKTLQMHPLAQETCHLQSSSPSHQESFEIAVSLLSHMWPSVAKHSWHQKALWQQQQPYIPHIISIAHYYRQSRLPDEQSRPFPALNAPRTFPQLLRDAAWYFYETSLPQPAFELLDIAEEYCMTHEGSFHILLAEIYGTRGALETETNRFKAAYKSMSDRLHWTNLALEEEHLQRPTIYEVIALSQIANGHMAILQYSEAEPFYRKALEVWKDLPGDSTLTQTNLGTCLRLQGKLDEAAELLFKLKDFRETKFGAMDKSSFMTAGLLMSVGNVLIEQNRLDEAFETHLRSFELHKATAGASSHKTAAVAHKLGWHFHRKRDYANAQSMLQQALDIYGTNQFYQNEITRTTWKLGCVLQDSGNVDEGRVKIETAENSRAKILDSDWYPATSEKDYDSLIMMWSR